MSNYHQAGVKLVIAVGIDTKRYKIGYKMNTYLTEIKAINPKSGELETHCGVNVSGISFKDAQEYCDNNGLGYCNVIGVLVADIPCDDNYKADFSGKIDYENIKLN